MKKIVTLLLSRSFLFGSLMLIQVAILLSLISFLSLNYLMAYTLMTIISFFVVIYIINKDLNPSYKIAWILVVLLLPLVGGVLYLFFGGKRIPKNLRQQELRNIQMKHYALKNEEKILKELKQENVEVYGIFNYLRNHAYSTTYNDTDISYYSSGDFMYQKMLLDIKNAKKYIFLEFFIIKPGSMWHEILTLLKEKIAEGVEVYLLYDDFGVTHWFDKNFEKELISSGIKVKVFNKLKPILLVYMNNRDHRKILVVDGKIGYTGGINIADEYIDRKIVFGKWKDGGVRLEGRAVDSLVYLFLQMFYEGVGIEKQYKTYCSKRHNIISNGIVCPFGDSPTDGELVGRDVHLSLINRANHSIYITTPYLILDQELKVGLSLAARRGVDVKIIVPGIADKKIVNQVTKSNYEYLANNGVEIYEYKPGFMHLKTMLIDDNLAYVGTINMDYRSYYLHFECGVLIYQSRCLADLKEDIIETIEVSELITIDDIRSINIFIKIIRAILNLMAPIM
ncbi:MAG: cardiolipin synthase [Erysipelotrichaceae bacterium]